MDIEQAIKAHLAWKTALRKAIESKSHIDTRFIGNDTSCALGHWLHGDAEHRFTELVSYWDCVIAHSELHREAERIAKLIGAGKYDDAHAALRPGSIYSNASNRILIALKMFEAEARLQGSGATPPLTP